MRILSLNPEPLLTIPFLNAGRGPGAFYVDQLPIHVANVDRLPSGLAAIVATADLQGRELLEKSRAGRVVSPPRLLGEVLPLQLVDEVLPQLQLPPGEVGILLAGDFYTVPALDRRGGSGDVTSVWRAFADAFAWVVGVAGNHDMFGEHPSTKPRFHGPVHYLDASHIKISELLIAGLGGIMGNPAKLHRRSEADYLRALEALLENPTDILLMHEGPDAPLQGFRGSPRVREILEFCGPPLVVRGHAHWQVPWVEFSESVQVLNVDARVVILRDSN